MTNRVSAQNYAITEAEIEQNRIDMATSTMQPNFRFSPNGNIGKVSYAFGSYYTGVNTAIADQYILELNSTNFLEGSTTKGSIYFQTPILLRFS